MVQSIGKHRMILFNPKYLFSYHRICLVFEKLTWLWNNYENQLYHSPIIHDWLISPISLSIIMFKPITNGWFMLWSWRPKPLYNMNCMWIFKYILVSIKLKPRTNRWFMLRSWSPKNYITWIACESSNISLYLTGLSLSMIVTLLQDG